MSRAVQGRPTLTGQDAHLDMSLGASRGRRRASIAVVQQQRKQRASVFLTTRRETMMLVEDLATDQEQDWCCGGRRPLESEDASAEERRFSLEDQRTLSTAELSISKTEESEEEDIPRICGIDKRILLPFGLLILMLIGICDLVFVQWPLGKELPGSLVAFCVFAVVYFVTLAAMGVTICSNPGTLSPERYARVQNFPDGLPERAHCNKGYATPILRYDHYCRWVMNVIGLMNHRPFMIMVTGIAICILGGVLVDAALIFWILTARPKTVRIRELWRCLALMLHFFLYLTFGRYVLPIFKLHLGFVSRNELCKEWVDDSHQVVGGIPVCQLDEDTYNDEFDNFEYDSSLNKWDQHSCFRNCMVFWCTPRWDPDQVGEF